MDNAQDTNSENESSKDAHTLIPWYYRFFGVKSQEIIFFVQHLGVMLKAGISLSRALKTLSDQTDSKYMSLVLHDIFVRVDKGQSLAKSLGKYPKIFPELFINMMHAGEISGKYEEVLKHIYVQMKKSHELKGKIRGAMIYPIIVVIAMISIAIAMLIFVIPKLTGIFDEVSVQLPLPTRILISISNFGIEYSLFIIVGLVFSIIAAIFIFKKEKPRFYLHSIILILPIVSSIIKKINIARFARTLGSLLKTDIPIIKSLVITSNVVGSRPYRQALLHSSKRVQDGKTLNSSLKEYPKLFSPIITQMIIVGEETGSLDTVLDELSLFYEDEVNQTMNNLPAILEPVLMLLLGVGVGSMAVAIIMPLYSITQAI